MNVLEEHAARRVGWDALAVLMVAVTWALVPFGTSFGFAPWGLPLLYAVDVFFWCDIALNFRTSYRVRGVQVTDPRMTADRYRRTLFPADLLVNLPYELLALPFGGASAAAALRFVRLGRIHRCFAVFGRWERMASTNSGYLRIGKYLLSVTALMHLLACLWFLQAAVAGFPERSWAVREGVRYAPAAVQYARAAYWTVTTMTTVGYGDVTPGTGTEYLFAGGVMLLGASLYAFLIGNVAALAGNLDRRRSAYRDRTDAVTGFLRGRHVPRRLIEKVRDYYDYLWERHNGWQNADFINELPGPLRLELMAPLTGDLLENVPLFRHASPHLRKELMHGLRLETYTPDTRIVQAGEMGREVYFISQGSMVIMADDGGREFGTLGPGDYFGVLSLVLGEPRTASVYTREYCDVFVLRAPEFERIRRDYPEFAGVLKTVAAEKRELTSRLVLEGAVL